MALFNAVLTLGLNNASLQAVQKKIQSGIGGIKSTVDVAVSPQANNQIQQISASLSILESRAKAAGVATRNFTSQATNNFYEFGQQIGLATRRFAAFTVAAGAIYSVVGAFKDAISGALAFDLSLNKLAQVAGGTSADVKDVGDEVLKLSTKLGVSSKDLAETAITFQQAGLSLREVKVALDVAAKAALAPNFKDLNQIGEGMIATYQQFGKNIDKLADQIGAVNAVAGDFAVEASDLITAVQKAGGTASQTGAQFNELLAVFTSIRSTTRESADSISTGLRTIFTRLQSGNTVDALKSLGINLRFTQQEAKALGDVKLESQFVGMYEAVHRLSEGLSKLNTTDPRFAAAIQELGGYRQVSRVIPLIQQFGEAQKALNVARLGSASLESAAAQRQDAFATKITKTREEFQKLVIELTQTRGFKQFTDVAFTMANAFIQVAGALKPLIPLITALAAVKIGSGVVSLAAGFRDRLTDRVGSSTAPSRRRFHDGGHAGEGWVPGHGNGDTVDAKLTPGEFVLRKESAKRIGPAALRYMNKKGRVPSGYNSGGSVTYGGGGTVGYADGGAVGGGFELNESLVRRIISQFSRKTGVDYSKLVNSISINEYGVHDSLKEQLEENQKARGRVDKAGKVIFPRGSYGQKDKRLGLNTQHIKDEETLRGIIAHELGHGVDATLNGGTGYSSKQVGTPASQIPGAFESTLRANDIAAGRSVKDPEFQKYRYSPEEVFAEAHKSHLLGNDIPAVGKLLGQLQSPKFTAFAPAPLPAAPREHINDVITRVLSKLKGVSEDDRQNAAIRLAEHAQAGGLPEDPKELEEVLTKAARRASDASRQKESRYRSKHIQGATNQKGRQVLDSLTHKSTNFTDSRITRSGPQSVESAAAGQNELERLSEIFKYGVTEPSQVERIHDYLAGDPTRTVEGYFTNKANAGPDEKKAPTPLPANTSRKVNVRSAAYAPTRTSVPAGRTVPPLPPSVADNIRALPPHVYPKALSAHVDPDTYGFAPIPLGTSLPNLPPNQILAGGKGVITNNNIPLAGGPNFSGSFTFAHDADARTLADRKKIDRYNNSEASLGIPRLTSHNFPNESTIPLASTSNVSTDIFGSSKTLNVREERANELRASNARERAEAQRAFTNQDFRNRGLQSADLNETFGGRARSAIENAGGPALLSGQGLLEKAEKAHAEAERELTLAIERQIKAKIPGITATEALRKAEEEAARTISNNESILLNKHGRIAGSASLGADLASAGLNPEGRGRISQFLAERGGRAGRFASGISDRLRGNGGLAGFAAISAAPLIGSQFEPSDEVRKNAAVSEGAASSVRRGSSISGALTGAAAGAAIGSIIPGIGTAVGAVVGASLGIAQGLSAANREIKDAKIGESLTKLNDVLHSAATSIAGPSGINPDELKRLVDDHRKTINENVNSTTQGFFSNSTAAETAAVRTKETRSILGPAASSAIAVLSRQAEDLAKSSPDAKTSDLAPQLNTELLKIVADVRDVPVAQVLKEFTESINVAQRQVVVQRDIEKGRRAAEDSATALVRLADAVGNAALSTDKFEHSMASLSGIFNGQSGATKIGNSLSGGFSRLGSGQGAEFRQSASSLSQILGKSGEGFINQATAVDKVSRELPTILQELSKANLGEGGDVVSTKTRDLLKARLLPGQSPEEQDKSLKADPALQSVLTSVVGRISHVEQESSKDGGLQRRLREDPQKVAEDAISASEASLKETGVSMSKAIEENGQKFADALAHARTQIVAIGESQDKVAELRLAGQRIQAETTADRTGRNATDLLSLQNLSRPFQERQERLTGFAGDQANSPEAIGAKLKEVVDEIKSTEPTVKGKLGDKEGLEKTLRNLDKLNGASNNLQASLRHLANASERAAILQEKLSSANANKDSRLSFAEKFFSSSPEEQLKLHRGQDIVSRVDSGKANFHKDLSSEEQRLFIESANDLGQARLRSGRTAAGLKEQVLGGVPGVLDRGQEGERHDLQNKLAEVFNTAQQAQQILANFQRDTNKTFTDELKGMFEHFFAELKNNFQANNLGKLLSQQTIATGNKNELKKLQDQHALLGTINAGTPEGLKAAKEGQADITSFLAAQNKINEFSKTSVDQGAIGEAFKKQAGDVSKFSIDSKPLDSNESLKGILPGIDSFSAEKREELLTNIRKRSVHELSARGSRTDGDVNANIFSGIASEELRKARESTLSGLTSQRDVFGSKLISRGINPGPIANFSEGDAKLLAEALKHSENDFSNLSTKVAEAGKALDELTGQINALKALSGGTGTVAEHHAAGGSIFKPKGSDTVPAMLTPGEFVVNARASQANRALLEKLNRHPGSVDDKEYRADGDGMIRKAYGVYNSANDAIRSGLGWLGLAAGGAVPRPYGITSSDNFAEAQAFETDKAAEAKFAPLTKKRFAAAQAAESRKASIEEELRLQQETGFNRDERAAIARENLAIGRQTTQAASDKALLTPGASKLFGKRRVVGAQARTSFFEGRGTPDQRRAAAVQKVREAKALQDLAANDQFNSSNVGYQQSLFRGAGLPGEEGQIGAAIASVAEQREATNEQFRQTFGQATYAARASRTSASFQSADIFRQRKALGLAGGGRVPGSGSGDSVPAMLTPGEYVFSKPAVKSMGAGNLDRVHRYAAGGMVGYLSEGGYAAGGAVGGPGAAGIIGLDAEAKSAIEGFGSSSKELASSLTQFGTGASNLTRAMETFNSSIEKLAGVMEKFPSEVNHTLRGDLNVNMNGTQGLEGFESSLKQWVVGHVTESMNKEFAGRMPDAPNRTAKADPTNIS